MKADIIRLLNAVINYENPWPAGSVGYAEIERIKKLADEVCKAERGRWESTFREIKETQRG